MRTARLSADSELHIVETISREEMRTLVAQLLHERDDLGSIDEREVECCALDAFDDAIAQHDAFEEPSVPLQDAIDMILETVSAVSARARSDEARLGPSSLGSALASDPLAKDSSLDDARDMRSLALLISILANKSVAHASGARLCFDFDPVGLPMNPPRRTWPRTRVGIALDLGKHEQRIVTPWGPFPLEHALVFPGYNQGARCSAGAMDFVSHAQSTSLFLFCCRARESEGDSQLLRLTRLSQRPLFALDILAGARPARAEVVDEDEGHDERADERASLDARFECARSMAAAESAAATAADPGVKGCPSAAAADSAERLMAQPLLLNRLLGTVVLADEALVEPLELRCKKSRALAALATASSSPGQHLPRHELLEALAQAGNSVPGAYVLLRTRADALDRLVALRKGYTTRERCAEALTVCRGDIELANFSLDTEPSCARVAAELAQLAGIESGLGFPTGFQIATEVARARGSHDATALALRVQWADELAHMREIGRGQLLEDLLHELRELRPGCGGAPGDAAASQTRANANGDEAQVDDGSLPSASDSSESCEPTAAGLQRPSPRSTSLHPGRAHVLHLLAHRQSTGAGADSTRATGGQEQQLQQEQCEWVLRLLRSAHALLLQGSELGGQTRASVESVLIELGCDERKARALLTTLEHVRRSRFSLGSPSRRSVLKGLERAKWETAAAHAELKAVYRLISPRIQRKRALRQANDDSFANKCKIDGRAVRHVLTAGGLVRCGAVVPWARSAAECALHIAANDEEEAIVFLVRVAKAQLRCPDTARPELEFAARRAYAAAGGVGGRGQVAHEGILAQWSKLDQFIQTTQPYGAPTRECARKALQSARFDEHLALERIRARWQIAELSRECELSLSAEQICELLAQYAWDVTQLERYLRGMHALQGSSVCTSKEDIEAVLQHHCLDAEQAHRHLHSLAELRRDRALLASAGEPADAVLERTLALVGYDLDKARVLLVASEQLVRACVRWGSPSREQVEAVIVEHALEVPVALEALRDMYRKAQFEVFRHAQAVRRAQQAAEADMFSLVRAPPSPGKPGARNRRASL